MSSKKLNLLVNSSDGSELNSNKFGVMKPMKKEMQGLKERELHERIENAKKENAENVKKEKEGREKREKEEKEKREKRRTMNITMILNQLLKRQLLHLLLLQQ